MCVRAGWSFVFDDTVETKIDPGRPTGQSKTRPTLQAGLTPCASVAWLGRAGQPHAGHALFQAPTNGSKHRHQNTHRVLSATLYERTRVGKGSAATEGHNPVSTSARARRWGGGGNLPGAGSVDGMKGSQRQAAKRTEGVLGFPGRLRRFASTTGRTAGTVVHELTLRLRTLSSAARKSRVLSCMSISFVRRPRDYCLVIG